MPSSAFTNGTARRSVSASASLGNHTHLTIPDPDDEEDYGVVRGVAVPNPFKSDVENTHKLPAVVSRNMDDLSENEVDMVDAYLHGAVAEFVPYPSDLSVQDQIQGELLKSLHVGGGVGEETPAEEQAPAGEEEVGEEEDEFDPVDNWADQPKVKKHVVHYEKIKPTIRGHEKWSPQQAHLHKLIALRGHWPMLPRSWIFHFKMRNVVPDAYAPEGIRRAVAIHAKSNDFRGKFAHIIPPLHHSLKFTS